MSAGHSQDRHIDDKTELSAKLKSYLTPQFRLKVKRLLAKVSTVKGYDNPYLVGRSTNMARLYPDRHFPEFLKIRGRRVNVWETTAVHEATEWILMHEDGVEYTPAHEVANHEEKAYVDRKYGNIWKPYCDVLDQYVKGAESERVKRVPKDLDLTPFEDEDDRKRLQELRSKMRNGNAGAARSPG